MHGRGPNFGRSRQTLARIDAARTRQQVCVDVYPYTAGSTVLLPELIAQASRIVVSWSTPHPAMAGRDLDAIAAEWGAEPIEAMKRLQPGGGIYFMMDDADVERIMAYPHAMFGSDGLPGDRFPHPRLWGTFPRVLGHYARDRRLFPLEDAIHRMNRYVGGAFRAEGSRNRFALATSPILCCSIPRRSRTRRRLSIRLCRRAALIWSMSMASQSGLQVSPPALDREGIAPSVSPLAVSVFAGPAPPRGSGERLLSPRGLNRSRGRRPTGSAGEVDWMSG